MRLEAQLDRRRTRAGRVCGRPHRPKETTPPRRSVQPGVRRCGRSAGISLQARRGRDRRRGRGRAAGAVSALCSAACRRRRGRRSPRQARRTDTRSAGQADHARDPRRLRHQRVVAGVVRGGALRGRQVPQRQRYRPGAGGDLQKAISDVNSVVAQGVNAITIIPDCGQAQLPSLQDATSQASRSCPGAPIPAASTAPTTSPTSTGNHRRRDDVGTVDGQGAGGKGNVVYLGGPAGSPVGAQQLDAIEEVFAANPGMKLLTGTTTMPSRTGIRRPRRR